MVIWKSSQSVSISNNGTSWSCYFLSCLHVILNCLFEKSFSQKGRGFIRMSASHRVKVSIRNFDCLFFFFFFCEWIEIFFISYQFSVRLTTLCAFVRYVSVSPQWRDSGLSLSVPVPVAKYRNGQSIPLNNPWEVFIWSFKVALR